MPEVLERCASGIEWAGAHRRCTRPVDHGGGIHTALVRDTERDSVRILQWRDSENCTTMPPVAPTAATRCPSVFTAHNGRQICCMLYRGHPGGHTAHGLGGAAWTDDTPRAQDAPMLGARLDGLTPEEGRIADALLDAVHGFGRVTKQHPSEEAEFVDAVHRIQDLLCVRVARRAFPGGWPTHQERGT